MPFVSCASVTSFSIVVKRSDPLNGEKLWIGVANVERYFPAPVRLLLPDGHVLASTGDRRLAVAPALNYLEASGRVAEVPRARHVSGGRLPLDRKSRPGEGLRHRLPDLVSARDDRAFVHQHPPVLREEGRPSRGAARGGLSREALVD